MRNPSHSCTAASISSTSLTSEQRGPFHCRPNGGVFKKEARTCKMLFFKAVGGVPGGVHGARYVLRCAGRRNRLPHPCPTCLPHPLPKCRRLQRADRQSRLAIV